MGFSTSFLSYPDCKEALDRALASKKGIRLVFKTHAAAHRFVARSCAFRVLDRKENAKLHHEGATLHGRSVYDVLRICRKDTEVEIIPIVLDPALIVDLDEEFR